MAKIGKTNASCVGISKYVDGIIQTSDTGNSTTTIVINNVNSLPKMITLFCDYVSKPYNPPYPISCLLKSYDTKFTTQYAIIVDPNYTSNRHTNNIVNIVYSNTAKTLTLTVLEGYVFDYHTYRYQLIY